MRWLFLVVLVAARLPLASPKWLGYPSHKVFHNLKRDLLVLATASLMIFDSGIDIAQGDDVIGTHSADILPSDEYIVSISEKTKLGIGLVEINYKQQYHRVVVNSIKDDAVTSIKQNVEKDDIIVQINGRNTEGISKDDVYKILKEENNPPFSIVFRRPSRFYSWLDSSVNGNIMNHITTVVTPSTTNAKKQLLDVKRILTSDPCTSSAKRGDIIEVLVTKDSEVSDGSEKSEFYVLGDLDSDLLPGLQLGLYGMCPQELRSISVPPSLLNSDSISNQVYNVKLISLNNVQ